MNKIFHCDTFIYLNMSGRLKYSSDLSLIHGFCFMLQILKMYSWFYVTIIGGNDLCKTELILIAIHIDADTFNQNGILFTRERLPPRNLLIGLTTALSIRNYLDTYFSILRENQESFRIRNCKIVRKTVFSIPVVIWILLLILFIN